MGGVVALGPFKRSIVEAVHHELNDAEVREHRIVQIRVTRDALPGSITTVVMTPERARRYVGSVVVRIVTPELLPGEAWPDVREILIHPLDWERALLEPDPYAAVVLGQVTSILGVPVVPYR